MECLQNEILFVLQIPFIVPQYEYKFNTFINCFLQATNTINLIVSNQENTILSAVINMPPGD